MYDIISTCKQTHTPSCAERRKKTMRTACKSAYNKSAISLQCTHAQRSKRKIHSNRSKETITIWSIRKGSVIRPSDVQWVKVVQCTEPREVVLNGKLQSSRQCIIMQAPLIWPIIDSHRFLSPNFFTESDRLVPAFLTIIPKRSKAKCHY